MCRIVLTTCLLSLLVSPAWAQGTDGSTTAASAAPPAVKAPPTAKKTPPAAKKLRRAPKKLPPATKQSQPAQAEPATKPAPEAPPAPEASETPAPEAATEKPDVMNGHPALWLGEWFMSPEAQIRPRVFATTNRDFNGTDDRAFVTNRSRLGLTLGHSNGIQLKVLIQDVRIWGEEDSPTSDFWANGLDVQEAYARVPLFGLGELLVGRQEVNVENQRLIGALDWAQRARSFDGLRLKLGLEKLALQAFGFKVQEADQNPDGTVPDGRNSDVDLLGLHMSLEFLETHHVAFMYIFNGDYELRRSRHTLGGTVHGSVAKKRLTYRGELFYQGGQESTSRDGVLAAALVGYQMLGVTTKPKISAWGEFVSGGFNTLYATNHKFYGEMDFFLNIPANTLGLGLLDIGGRAEFFPAEKLRFNVDFHHFRSGESDASNNQSWGNEFNFKISYKFMKFVGTRILYGFFLPDELMRTRFSVPARRDLRTEHLLYWTLDFKI